MIPADGPMRISLMADEEFVFLHLPPLKGDLRRCQLHHQRQFNPIYKLPSLSQSIASPPTKESCLQRAPQTLISIFISLDRQNHLWTPSSLVFIPLQLLPTPLKGAETSVMGGWVESSILHMKCTEHSDFLNDYLTELRDRPKLCPYRYKRYRKHLALSLRSQIQQGLRQLWLLTAQLIKCWNLPSLHQKARQLGWHCLAWRNCDS